MSSAIFPDLPGLNIVRARTPIWKTRTRESASGKELRLALMASPRWRYRLGFEVLRAGAEAELQQVVGLFNSMRGSWGNFLYLDPADSTATAAQFGTGDGTTTQFQLARPLGGFVEPVEVVKGAATIYKDGTPQAQPAACSVIAATGQVSFVTPPAPGTVLTWSGEYYWRCRFTRDEAEFEEFLRDLWRWQRVEFITVKGELA